MAGKNDVLGVDGASAAIAGVDHVPAILTVSGEDSYKLEILKVNGGVAENYQRSTSFTGAVYVTTMGKRMVPMTIMCLAFNPETVCDESGSMGTIDDLKGWYDVNNLGQGVVVEVTFGYTTIKGLLNGMNFGVEGKRTAVHTLNLMGISV